MGCWNHTCAISNLPVMHHDEVYVILLVAERDDDPCKNNCYPTAYWRPYPAYFTGKYDDYGAVEECTGPMLNTIIEAVRKDLIEVEQGENEYHDIPVKKADFNLELLFEANHENRLFVKAWDAAWEARDGRPIKRRMEHIVIRKAVFEKILSEFKIELYNYTTKERGIYGAEQLKADGIKTFTEKLNKIKELETRKEAGEDVKLELNRLIFMAELSLDRSPFGNAFEELFRFVPNAAQDIKYEIMENRDESKIADYVEQIANLYWLGVFMGRNRRVWTPTCGAGSQDMETDTHRLLAQITLDEAHKIEKMYDEEYGEEDGED